MFFKQNLLIQSEGEFTLIWLLAHNKVPRAKLSEVAELNIGEKCEALLKYVPTGDLSNFEVRNKMSLYLLAVLQHGIVIAFSRKTEIVLSRLNEAIAKYFKSQFKVPVKRKAVTKNKEGKRTRRTTSNALPAVQEIEEEEEERMIDLRSLPAEQISNRYRVSDKRQITIEDRDVPQQGFFDPDIQEFEEMMRIELDRQSQRSLEAGSRASMNEDMQSLYAELTNGMNFEMDAFASQRHLTVDRRSVSFPHELNQTAEDNIISSLQLPVLTEAELNEDIAEQRRVVTSPAVRRPRRRNLIVDKQIELTNKEMRRNLENYDNICVDRRFKDSKKRLPTVRELIAPLSYYLIKKAPEFDSLLKGAVKAAVENLANREQGGNEPRQESVAEMRRKDSMSRLGSRAGSRAGDHQIEEMPMEVEQLPVVEQIPSQVAVAHTMNWSSVPFDPTFDRTHFEQFATQMRDNQPGNFVPSADSLLLERIKSCKGDRERVEFMEFANKASKITVARDFVNLLHLLKNRSITVDQGQAYAEIFVKLADV